MRGRGEAVSKSSLQSILQAERNGILWDEEFSVVGAEQLPLTLGLGVKRSLWLVCRALWDPSG